MKIISCIADGDLLLLLDTGLKGTFNGKQQRLYYLLACEPAQRSYYDAHRWSDEDLTDVKDVGREGLLTHLHLEEKRPLFHKILKEGVPEIILAEDAWHRVRQADELAGDDEGDSGLGLPLRSLFGRT